MEEKASAGAGPCAWSSGSWDPDEISQQIEAAMQALGYAAGSWRVFGVFAVAGTLSDAIHGDVLSRGGLVAVVEHRRDMPCEVSSGYGTQSELLPHLRARLMVAALATGQPLELWIL